MNASAPGADAGGRWAGLQARADDLSRELYRLRESSSDEGERMRVEDTLNSLRALRSALEPKKPEPKVPDQAQASSLLENFSKPEKSGVRLVFLPPADKGK